MSAIQRHGHAESAPFPSRIGTTAAGAMQSTKAPVPTIKIGGWLEVENTRSGESPRYDLLDLGTSSVLRSFIDPGHGQGTPTYEAEATTNEPARNAILELRLLSGLTWDQLARLFGVSRRSVHLWVSGKPMSTQNEERLYQLLALLQEVDRGSADENRRLLLTPTDSGYLPIDLLAAGEFERVRQTLGPGSGRRQVSRTPLSISAWEARLPPKPEFLVDARHEPVHKEPGVARAARAKRATGQ